MLHTQKGMCDDAIGNCIFANEKKGRQIFAAKQKKIEILTELDFLSVLFYLSFEKSSSNVICNTSM